ncbi:Galactoside 2-alpha-L-fucosyltransferase [Glycine soja]
MNIPIATERNVLPGIFQNGTASEERNTTTNNSIASGGVGSKNVSFTSSPNKSSTTPDIDLDDKDKLLGGLLTTGFDEASCITIHTRCGPNTRSYDRSMRKIVRSKNKGAATLCNMAATFLYAILTDRVLLVKFDKDKHGLFCEPFLNSTWILPEKSPFWNEKHIETYHILLEKDGASNLKEGLPSVLFINLQHTLSEPEKYFHCDHSQDLLRKVPLMILQSDQYFVPSLFMNPFFNLEVTKMFPEKDTVFHHLGRYLFQPSNEAWELISSYYEAHLAKADERIGLQIRVFNAISTPQETVMDLVLSCTLKHKILTEVELQSSASSARKNQTTVKAVLVASLYREYGDNLRRMYRKNPTPSHEEHQKYNDNKHNMKAWIDMYLLSLSDELVTTSLSTFGYVAQGLGNLKPWLLYRLVNNETHFPLCERDFSSEPCYHVPPKHYCNGKPMKNVSSFPPSYLRECKDYCFGLKMLEGLVETVKMAPNSMSFPMFFVMFSIAFPVVVTVTFMYRNSSFGLFEGYSEGNLQRGTSQNVTTAAERLPNVTETHGFQLGRAIQNTTHDSSGGKDQGNNNSTVSSGVKERQRRSQNHTSIEGRIKNNITTADDGSKIASLTSSKNDSTPPHVNLDDNDKLLGGLLTSGFDEESCISRIQSHLYRKASPHKPSPYLISKLRNYEEIHTRCGPNTRAYHRSMTMIEHSKNKEFGKDKHGLFCEPFLNSTWILPRKSPFWNEKHIETYQILLEKDRASNSTEDLPSVLFINLQHTRSDPEKYFHCGHSQDLLQKIPLLILQSDQYFVPSLFMNPFFNQEVTKMFPEKETVFHHLGRYLFHPSNEAWKLISDYYEAHLAKADKQIGLQIRVFSPVSTPQQAVMDLVLSCTLKHKILPQVDLQTSAGKNQTTVKAVLVASLYREYGDNLKRMYRKNPTLSGEVIKVYQPSHEEHQKYNDNKHNMKAWIDMYLLSLSDELVTTSLSTFGYVAQGLGNLKPWLLYKLVNNETHFPPCERDFSSEPCYHFPPKHYCNGEPLKDIVSSFPYLRPCKDFRVARDIRSTSTASRDWFDIPFPLSIIYAKGRSLGFTWLKVIKFLTSRRKLTLPCYRQSKLRKNIASPRFGGKKIRKC